MNMNKDDRFNFTAIIIIFALFTLLVIMTMPPVQAEENRFTEPAKKAAEKVNGMTEQQEKIRLKVLLEELNRIFDKINLPIDKRYEKMKARYSSNGSYDYDCDDLLYYLVSLELQVEILQKHRDEFNVRLDKHNEKIEQIHKASEKEKARIDKLSGYELHKEFQKMLKDHEDMKRLQKIADDL